MTQLTEHAKTILRAVADGKQIEHRDNNGKWVCINTMQALNVLTYAGGWDDLRIKPETRSINGKEFAAPKQTGGYRMTLTHGTTRIEQDFDFVEAKDRDTAYQAVIDALGGKTP